MGSETRLDRQFGGSGLRERLGNFKGLVVVRPVGLTSADWTEDGPSRVAAAVGSS
jgi:hypothetical protein